MFNISKTKKILSFVNLPKFLSKVKEEINYQIKTTILKLKDLSSTNFNLGLLHLKKNNIKDAKFRFWIVNKLKPEDQIALYYLALCQDILGERDKSLENLKKCLSIDPYFAPAGYLLIRIESPDSIKTISEDYLINLAEISVKKYDYIFENYEKIYAKIKSNIEEKNPRLNLLECGYNQDNLSKFFKNDGFVSNVNFIDIAANKVQEAKNLIFDQEAKNLIFDNERLFLKCSQASLKEFLQTSNEKFDFIISFNSLQNYAEPLDIIALCKNNLNKNGYIALGIIDTTDKEFQFNDKLDLFYHNEKNVAKILSKLGFKKLLHLHIGKLQEKEIILLIYRL